MARNLRTIRPSAKRPVFNTEITNTTDLEVRESIGGPYWEYLLPSDNKWSTVPDDGEIIVLLSYSLGPQEFDGELLDGPYQVVSSTLSHEGYWLRLREAKARLAEQRG